MENVINLERLQLYDKNLLQGVLLRREYDLSKDGTFNSLTFEKKTFKNNKTTVKGLIRIIAPRLSTWFVKIWSPVHPYASYYTTALGSFQVSNVNTFTFNNLQEINITVDEEIEISKIVLTEIGDTNNIVNVSELVNDKGYVSLYHNLDQEQIIFNN